MSKITQKALRISQVVLGMTLAFSSVANADEGLTDRNNTLEQINNINQLRDVSPRDWSYEALRNLVESYGCIVGYPDRTFRGSRPLTRNEFAAGLNACLQQLERRILEAKVTSNETAAVDTYDTPRQTIPEAFNQAFNNESGGFFNIVNLGGQLNTIFGWKSFPMGSYRENQVTQEGEIVSTVLQDVLKQQAGSYPVMRTRDLNNPYNTSLIQNPSYLGNSQPVEGTEVIIEQRPFFP
jgi:hypothetical protein